MHVRQSRGHEHVDAAQQVRGWDPFVEAEGVEEPSLIASAAPHHRSRLPTPSGERNHAEISPSTDFFTSIGQKRWFDRHLPLS